ncbi:MAG: hypothetical protein ACFFDB_00565 [Promethearchaeota archaeon]
MNNQHKVFLVGIILLVSCIIPYTLLFMSEISEESEESSESVIETLTPANKIFPDDYLDNITEITEVKGYNISGTYEQNLMQLKANEGNTYDIKGRFNSSIGLFGKYEFDIQFFFGANLNYIEDFYDLFLYFDSEFSINSEEVYLQALQIDEYLNEEWINISVITNIPLNINKELIKTCYTFRIFGFTDADKQVSIDRIQFLLAHGKDANPFTNAKIGNYRFLTSHTITGYGVTGGYMTDCEYYNGKFYNLYVWEDVLTPGDETEERVDIWNTNTWVKEGTIDITPYINTVYSSPNWISMAHDIVWDGSNWWLIGHKNFVQIDLSHANFRAYFYKFDANWNYITNYYIQYNNRAINQYFLGAEWDGEYWNLKFLNSNKIERYTSSFSYVNTLSVGKFQDDICWNGNYFLTKGSHSNHYDKNWTFIQSGSMAGRSFTLGINDNHYYTLQDTTVREYEFLRPYTSVRVFSSPESPISTLENFQIRAELLSKNDGSNYGQVSAYIRNDTWNSGWMPMTPIGSNIWRTDSIPRENYQGIYEVWVNASEMFSASPYERLFTYNWTYINITNTRPRLHFFYPSDYETIDYLYNLNVNISVFDPDLDIYETPEIYFCTLEDEDTPIINWTEMERYDLLKPDIWNYTIHPILYANGLYKIKVRTSESAQFIGYGENETIINIQNDPPDITIIHPTEQELISPISQTLQVNISNEEPINSAQWDITSILGVYSWKNLTYNPISEFYEAQINLTSYKYGDYFLVINATDDKYNSSLEIKTIQIHILLTYYIPFSSISYNNKGIKVSILGSDEVLGSFTLLHHPVAQERDFDIYIPDDYEDAHNYYLIRGYNTYFPVGFNVEGIYTLWKVPQSLPSDQINFKLNQPKIINQPFEEKDGDYELSFTLSTKHSFTDLTIENSLDEYISKPENYEYAVFYQYGGDLIEINDIKVDPSSGSIRFSFSWDSIDENSTIEFKFTAIQLEIEETDWTPIIVGATLGAFGIGISAFIIFGFKKHEDWGKAKSILLSIGIGAAAGIIGYVIVLMV